MKGFCGKYCWPDSLVWEKDDLKLLVFCYGADLDVNITYKPDGPDSESVCFFLNSEIQSASNCLRIKVIDGDGWDAGFKNQGVGSLLVSTATQMAISRMMDNAVFEGDISDLKENNLEDRISRRLFWSKIGADEFTGYFGECFKGQIENITINVDKKCLGKYPRFIQLSEFSLYI